MVRRVSCGVNHSDRTIADRRPGGRITSVCLRAIFGSSWENIPNTLPESAGITSKNLLGFFIFWIIQFPVMFVHPTILRHLFVIKAVYTTVALFAMGK